MKKYGEKNRTFLSHDGIRHATLFVCISILLNCTLLCSRDSVAQTAGKMPPIDGRVWRTHMTNMMPFGIVVTVLTSTEAGTMERSARIRLEFPRTDYSFHYALLQEPLPMEYYSFTRGRDSILHDIMSDTVMELPAKVSPISVFSLENSADSFFSNVSFADVEPEVFENQNTFVYKIVSDNIPFSPGLSLKNVNGHLWIDSMKGRPIKMIIMGVMTALSGEDIPSSLIIEFFYDKMTLNKSQWKEVDAALDAYNDGREDKAEAIIRKIEEEAAKNFAEAKK